MENYINLCDSLSTREQEIIYIYLCAKLKKELNKKPIKTYKYKLEFKNKIYNCNTLKEMSKITGIHELTIFKLVNGEIRFRNKRSEHLKDIKITKLYKRKEDIDKPKEL